MNVKPSTCALAYAIWDAENSVRMVKPVDINRHLELARDVQVWLQRHGYVLRKPRKLKKQGKPS